jgi:hypothetical protein
MHVPMCDPLCGWPAAVAGADWLHTRRTTWYTHAAYQWHTGCLPVACQMVANCLTVASQKDHLVRPVGCCCGTAETTLYTRPPDSCLCAAGVLNKPREQANKGGYISFCMVHFATDCRPQALHTLPPSECPGPSDVRHPLPQVLGIPPPLCGVVSVPGTNRRTHSAVAPPSQRNCPGSSGFDTWCRVL